MMMRHDDNEKREWNDKRRRKCCSSNIKTNHQPEGCRADGGPMIFPTQIHVACLGILYPEIVKGSQMLLLLFCHSSTPFHYCLSLRV
mmetsp:Transcript_18956/g.44319  ORF Transcript_18956/g.44319 Transcript_18956/m.44319 type:complete len:87 (-) Transcript_18956:243-503(-)